MNLSNSIKKWLLTLLQFAVGWHFFYEGFVKLTSSNWSAGDYLSNSTGFLASFYHWLGASAVLLSAVDWITVIALLLIGLALMLGVLVRWAASWGTVLLLLFYFAYPPWGAGMLLQPESSTFIINRQFLEALLLLVVALSKEKGFGLGNLLTLLPKKSKKASFLTSRREVLKNLATLPLLGVLGWGAFANKNKYEVDGTTGATIRIDVKGLNELKGELPKGAIGEHKISRLVAGGNLIGGWAHSRDLRYVPELFKAYNTEKKVFETLILAEKAGINTINIGFPSNPLLQRYKQVTGSKMKVISQIGPDMDNDDLYRYINEALEYGADIIQIQGNWCDWLVRDEKYEVIEDMMSYIRKQGVTAGLAAHTVDSLIACEEKGIIPDYYMKTMHHDNYWSAHPRENRQPFEVDGQKHLDHNRFHDNLFCLYPDKTVDFVNRAKVPVMGFKVLAAGAIEPEDGFRWAFENGADFICVGMFDFQVVKDVNITLDTLNNLNGRKREWYG